MIDIEKIKRRLGIQDAIQDILIDDIASTVEAHFKLLTGATAVDAAYSFIIEEITIKRYNRKGSEGITSETVDGYTATYKDTDDFKEYYPLLSRAYDLDGSTKVGVVRFV
jgi:hypothetical protein